MAQSPTSVDLQTGMELILGSAGDLITVLETPGLSCGRMHCCISVIAFGQGKRDFLKIYLVITMLSQCFQVNCILKCPQALLFSLHPSDDVEKPAGLSWV